jgi:hypothetical protein
LDCAAKTGTVDCSKTIISLEFFGYFLFQDKKYRGFGVATPSIKKENFVSRQLRSNQRGQKTINNNELKS